MQHSLKPNRISSCDMWHTPGASGWHAAVCRRPAALPCHPRPSRCVRSSIKRAADPQHSEQHHPTSTVGAADEPQHQQTPASGAAVEQTQQVATSVPQQQLQAADQAQQAPAKQQQVQPGVSQHIPAQQPEQQQQPQQQQQTQQQQRAATPAQPKPSPLQEQQQQQRTGSSSSVGTSNTHKQPPGWLQHFVSLVQHMPAALAAFLVGGVGACLLLYGWAKGSPMRKSQPYSFSMSFQEASKVDVGTPVRMKGVQIGSVTKVVLSPSHITAYAEVPDQGNIIPRASRVDINLLGLASDPWIDITPPVGCAMKKQHGPHHPDCERDGLILCNGGHIHGSQGGSTDFMMKFFLSQHDRTRQKTVDVIYHSKNA